MKKILFVSHDASRTGAPILLLNLIRWLKETEQAESFILLLASGPLQPEFEQVGKVVLWKKYIELVSKSRNSHGFVRRKILNQQIKLFKRNVKIEIKSFSPELIYFNTVATFKFLKSNYDLFLDYKLILHIHEMPFTIKNYISGFSSTTLNPFSKIIVVNSVIENFILANLIESQRVLKVTEYLVKIPTGGNTDENRNEVFTVLGVGYAGWRKGTDLFIQTAYYFSRIFAKPFLFKWVGELPDNLRGQVEHDLSFMNIQNCVEFTGPQANVSVFYKQCDVFFLASREDPYPLVMLEAGAHKKPIVYFMGSGGADEFVDTNGKCVEHFDPVLAAQAIHEIYHDYKFAETKANHLAEKIPLHSIELVGKKIINFIGS